VFRSMADLVGSLSERLRLTPTPQRSDADGKRTGGGAQDTVGGVRPAPRSGSEGDRPRSAAARSMSTMRPDPHGIAIKTGF